MLINSNLAIDTEIEINSNFIPLTDGIEVNTTLGVK